MVSSEFISKIEFACKKKVFIAKANSNMRFVPCLQVPFLHLVRLQVQLVLT